MSHLLSISLLSSGSCSSFLAFLPKKLLKKPPPACFCPPTAFFPTTFCPDRYTLRGRRSVIELDLDRRAVCVLLMFTSIWACCRANVMLKTSRTFSSSCRKQTDSISRSVNATHFISDRLRLVNLTHIPAYRKDLKL